MPSLRRMSARDVIRIMQAFGFEIASQKGSHIKLRRLTDAGERQTLTVPNHSELDTGTLRAILRQATRYVAASDLNPHFFA